MRRLDKSYPYQKPSKNRSSKDRNLILGPASVFPAYMAWSTEELQRAAGWCKNKTNNCYTEALAAKKKASDFRKQQRALKAAQAKSQPATVQPAGK